MIGTSFFWESHFTGMQRLERDTFSLITAQALYHGGKTSLDTSLIVLSTESASDVPQID